MGVWNLRITSMENKMVSTLHIKLKQQLVSQTEKRKMFITLTKECINSYNNIFIFYSLCFKITRKLKPVENPFQNVSSC